MKEILGLLFLVCVSVVTIYLSVTKQIEWKLTTVFFALGIFGGFLIARYDSLKLLQYGDAKMEAFEKQVGELKSKAIEEIKQDVNAQKEALQLVISDANATRRKLEDQKKTAEELVKRVGDAEEKLKHQQENLESIAKRTEGADERVAANEARVRAAESKVQTAEAGVKLAETQIKATETRLLELNRANKDLALLLTKMTWLQATTKNEIGTPRAMAALQEIDKELNRLLAIAIPDPVERNIWVQRLMTSLPKPAGQ